MSTESREPRMPPPLLMERLSVGELSAEQERSLRAEFGEAAIDDGLRLLRESDDSVRAGADAMVASIGRRVEASAQTDRLAVLRRLGLTLTPALAAAAAVYLAVVPEPLSPGGEPVQPTEPGRSVAPVEPAEPLEQTRIKGDPVDEGARKDAGVAAAGEGARVLVYRRVTEKGNAGDPTIEQLKDGSEVRAGDVLQMGYNSPSRYAALLSLDGRGQVTLHFPRSADAVPRLVRPQALLDFAYELDDSPSFERFFLVSGDAAFSVKQVLAAARTLGKRPKLAGKGDTPLKVPAGLSVTSLVVKKVSR